MITVVSGLPRSGTSLMMQMIKEGGIPVLTDDLRAPDQNNPRGYLEYEKVKALKKDNTWVPEAEGKAVKVISHLIYELPTDLHYKVVFMVRNLDEVIASQSSMLDRMGRHGAPVTNVELKRVFQKHLEQIKDWIGKNKSFEVLFVDHHDLVTNPAKEVERINEFFGGKLDTSKMVAMVDEKLYRERASK
jgi:Sulfotransferase domain